MNEEFTQNTETTDRTPQTYTQPQNEPNPQAYNQPYYPQMQQPYRQTTPPKGDGVALGVASLVLGVLSVFLFSCCINYLMAILAIVFGIMQLVQNRQKGLAIAGIVTAGLSILLATLLWFGIAFSMSELNFNQYDIDPFQFYRQEITDSL